jgi:hypothetical protein
MAVSIDRIQISSLFLNSVESGLLCEETSQKGGYHTKPNTCNRSNHLLVLAVCDICV